VSPRSWKIRIHDMLKAIDEATAIAVHKDAIEFKDDRAAVLAVLACIQILGEASNHVPDSIKEKYNNVPWNEIRGMRNRIAHEYFEIDENLVWETSKNDFPELKKTLEQVLQIEK
jgi:uncharacterized protein